jgi:hypothetical protein
MTSSQVESFTFLFPKSFRRNRQRARESATQKASFDTPELRDRGSTAKLFPALARFTIATKMTVRAHSNAVVPPALK